MSNIFLTSAGLKTPVIAKEFIKILSKEPSKLKLAHIITASNVAPDTAYVQKDKTIMKKLGFQVTDIDIKDFNQQDLTKKLKGFDIIYVQGGDGFYLLKQVRKSGFTQVVKELLKKGKIYVGVSAGTYIACPTIDMHTWKDNQREQYGLTDLTAMNLVSYLVSVHYNRDKYKVGLKEGILNSKYPVKVITDDQALYIKNGKTKLVGLGKEIKI